MKTKLVLRLVAVVLLVLAVRSGLPEPIAQEQVVGESVLLGDCLVLAPLGVGTRSLVFTDPVEDAFVRGNLKPPSAGDEVAAGGKTAKWTAAKADGGVIQHDALRGGYCWWTVTMPAARTVILDASGHVSVYVNGEPRVGDVYNMGIVRLPVRLQAGANHFVFRCARGRLAARLEPMVEELQVLGHDCTLPDITRGRSGEYCAAVMVANNTDKPGRFVLTASAGAGESARDFFIGAFSVRKCPMVFNAPAANDQRELGLTVTAARVAARTGEQNTPGPVSRHEFKLAVREKTENHRVTFISSIDGSVQYYAVNPARPLQPDQPVGIVLSCHGASVEATNQAAAYSGKSWCHIVCPTNRRHYGFDWEDWGRLDAMEVLAHAQATLKHDPSMVYLTGHSMGGHGAWQLAAHHPGSFAAVGPSAGWRSFWSYGGKQESGDDPISKLLRRSENGSDTLLLKNNYSGLGVYILHGDADETVPVTEARFMRDALKEFHADLHYHEQPGAGHWWDRGDGAGDKGADCVDWQPMFDLFARRRIPLAGQIREIDFTTINPAVSATHHWATVTQQQLSFAPSRIQLRVDPGMRRVAGTTSNVTGLMFAVGQVMRPGEVLIELDGEKLTAKWPDDGVLHLTRGATWTLGVPPAGAKSPARGGGFRSAFGNNCVIVYGTGGTEEVKRWAAAKARFDAEQFWYRGNGSIDVIPDTEFIASKYESRNVILVGSPDANSAYKAMNIDSPIQVLPGKVMIGLKELPGDLGLLAVVPRPGSTTTSVGMICGSSLAGMRLLNRIPYLAPGVGVPDFVVLDASMPRDGLAGVRAAGYFDNDWRLSESDIVIR